MNLFKKKLYYLLFTLKKYGLFYGYYKWIEIELFNSIKFNLRGMKHPIFLRRETTDKYAFRHIFLLNEYEQIEIENANWVIDAGSNIGLFSVYIKNRMPNCKIIALEPENSNYEQCKLNLDPYPGIYIENKGLWKKDCKLNIIEKLELGKWGTQVEESENGEIEATTISTLMKQYNIDKIDLLKIDIETSEKYIFEGDIEWLTKVKLLIIEFHDRLLPGTARPFFVALNKSIENYNMFNIGDNILVENLDIK